MSVLSNVFNTSTCGCGHSTVQQSELSNPTYLDVTPLFEVKDSYVLCDTKLAAQLNLYKMDGPISVPVYIQKQGNYISLYYDEVNQNQIVRSYIQVREVDDKLIPEGDVHQIILSGGIVEVDSVNVDVIQDADSGENILLIQQN